VSTVGAQVARTFVERLGDAVEIDAPLGPLTTYRVGGPAAVLVRPRSITELETVGEVVSAVLRAAEPDGALPLLVLGRGSNVLVADEGFAGVVVLVSEVDTAIDLVGDGLVRAGGGVALPVLARRTAALGLTGLEWMVGVPGSVGGAVRMNAGGHGSDVAASLRDVDIIDLATGESGVRSADRLGLRFRGSDISASEVVWAARFNVSPGDRDTSEAEIAEIVRWRRENQPGGQNAGSVFVNPVPGEVAAAQLIDGLGLRGLRIGSAEVSTKHANFIQADEGGRASDVRAVMETVRDRVRDECGVLLRSEVRLVGFADIDPGGAP
jgi:UDP-N-acetylmuramate dehydrogenase